MDWNDWQEHQGLLDIYKRQLELAEDEYWVLNSQADMAGLKDRVEDALHEDSPLAVMELLDSGELYNFPVFWPLVAQYQAVRCARKLRSKYPPTQDDFEFMIQAKAWDILEIVVWARAYPYELHKALVQLVSTSPLSVIKKVCSMRTPPKHVVSEMLEVLVESDRSNPTRVVSYLLELNPPAKAELDDLLNQSVVLRQFSVARLLEKEGGALSYESAKNLLATNNKALASVYLNKASYDDHTKSEANALTEAAITGGQQMVAMLRSHGFPIRNLHVEYALKANPLLVPYLLKYYKGDPSQVLDSAVEHGQWKAVGILMDQGAQPKDKHVQAALKYTQYDLVEAFLKTGLSANKVDLRQASPKMKALVQSYYKTAWDMLDDED